MGISDFISKQAANGAVFFVSWLQVPIDTEHYQNDVKAANLQENMERFHMLSPST